MSSWALEYIGPSELGALVRRRDAVLAIRDALRGGLEPADDPPRTVLSLPDRSAQMLTMPSMSHWAVGVKVVTAAPGNRARGLPRVQGIHLVFKPDAMQLVAAVDGAALTALRTPAVSIAAVLPALRRRRRGLGVVVFGAGPQGVGHVNTLRDVGCELAAVTYVVRHPSTVDVSQLDGAVVVSPDASVPALERADIVICATSSAVPVFDSHNLASHAVVMAVGSHEPRAREVDAALVSRSQVIVEDVATALRECGDIVMAIHDGAITGSELVPMARVARREVTLDDTRPVFFKGSGMAWQDAVVAGAAVRRLSATRRPET